MEEKGNNHVENLEELNSITDAVDVEMEEFQEEMERELTEEEKHELYVKQIKAFHRMRSNFKPIKHQGNKTINQFGAGYKKKRQRKNKVQKNSRKQNR